MPRAVRRHAIEGELKTRIRSGVYPLGSRFPSRRDLLAEFRISPVTLQRALDRLALQGFVVVRGHSGTYVSAHPPNQSCYALVFAAERGEGSWNRFWATALREAGTWGDASGRRFTPYFIAGNNAAAESHQRLCADAAGGLLAGVLFVSTPWYLSDSPIFSASIPRVVLGGEASDLPRYNASLVTLGDWKDQLEQICRAFIADGRRRFAALLHPLQAKRWREHAAVVQRSGLATRQSWWVGLPTEAATAHCAQIVTHLLLDRPATARPDALFIGDDNFVPHATAGVIDSGVQAPRELGIIAHANLPAPTPSLVPCRRFGPDMRRLLTTALAELDRLRAGNEVRQVVVPAAMITDGDHDVGS